ncbi:hypothetical protein [uncultured Massilia sp.]|uniref:hypothetical protein n=1 Tax=uncultured Massilia sp. TaxID=169973 RepID=UPI0025864648|nr:hypothetical protein [uncultured Massilia sp.]
MKPSTLVVLLLSACCLPAWASVDTSPKPGGVYKLKPGIYVASDMDCGSPPNAAIRRYDGKGISTAHTRACRATVQSRKGKVYTVRQSCIDAGSGPAPRFTQTQKISVPDALTFSQTIRGHTTTYRYCPVYQLPKELQAYAR